MILSLFIITQTKAK